MYRPVARIVGSGNGQESCTRGRSGTRAGIQENGIHHCCRSGYTTLLPMDPCMVVDTRAIQHYCTQGRTSILSTAMYIIVVHRDGQEIYQPACVGKLNTGRDNKVENRGWQETYM